MTNIVALHPLQAPDIETLRGYRSIYALCTVNRKTGELQASHYASVLVGGCRPTWGVWTVRGTFVRFAASRAQIERAYKELVWRRRMATWACVDYENKSIEKRREEIETLYGQKMK